MDEQFRDQHLYGSIDPQELSLGNFGY